LDEHADLQRALDAPCTLAVLGESDAARTLRDRLIDDGYTAAGIDEARCVVYVAEPSPEHPGESDFDCAVRLSAAVTDLVSRLAERGDHYPATLWIITRGVRGALSDAASRQSCLWGLAGVIGAEQPQLWGGLVDIPVCDDIGDCASALSTLLPTAAKSILELRDGDFLAPALVPVSGQPCVSRCGVVPTRLTSSPAAWAHSVC
jgi:phthiocerol/phenolphthiocerol synthesis type-I polyketide synthase A